MIVSLKSRPTYGDLMSITKPQRRALEIMADCSRWVRAGNVTEGPPDRHHQIHGATAQRLERLGLAKSRIVRLWENRYDRVFTLTRKGMKAIGWVGEVLR